MERPELLLHLLMSNGIGNVGIHTLINHFGSADLALGASQKELEQVKGLSKAAIAATLHAAELDITPELERIQELGITLLTFDDPQYPPTLRMISNPPVILYVRGKIDNSIPGIGIVGTRKATTIGLKLTEKFAHELAKAGFSIISGLAKGVDSAAHRAALLAANGYTVGVLGSGLAHIYPEENRDLAMEMMTCGMVVSEFPTESTPSKESFPKRNRTIAGMSVALLVTEAPLQSGALITVRNMLEMNRPVFALPGRVNDASCKGCNTLIKDKKALLVQDPNEIIEQLKKLRHVFINNSQTENFKLQQNSLPINISSENQNKTDKLAVEQDYRVIKKKRNTTKPKSGENTATPHAKADLFVNHTAHDNSNSVTTQIKAVTLAIEMNPEIEKIFSVLGVEAQSVDNICIRTGLSPNTIIAHLMQLEMAGKVCRHNNGCYARCLE